MKYLTDSELPDELKKRFDENAETLNALKIVNGKLVDVNRKLQESEALRSNFLSNIRNEINNPLTSILGFSQILVKGDSLDYKTVASMAGIIYKEAFNLDLQFRNLFTAAEIEAGETVLSISPADIDTLIHDTVQLFMDRAAAKKIMIHVDTLSGSGNEEDFMSDPEKLQLIIINLLSNAIEYSSADGSIELKVSRNESVLNITVKDYGIGIDKKDHSLIFDRFRQLDFGTAKGHPGHGVGLSVTKALTEMLNGTITLESAEGKGATFMLSVPEVKNDNEADVSSISGNEFAFEEF